MTDSASTLNDHPPIDSKYWWIQLILGMAFMICAFWFWFTPVETYISLAVFFSFAMFVTGVFEIANAFRIKKTVARWPYYLIGGIIDLVLGLILITHENLTLEVLPLLLGVWFLFRALAFFIGYGDLKKQSIKYSGWLLVGAILTLVFSIAILAKPILGELTLIYTVSFAFFFMGLYRLTLGVKLYNARKG
jgi:uncharacterized membrane protein HdeD (DUF308 family)